jgi:hypothetical protein
LGVKAFVSGDVPSGPGLTLRQAQGEVILGVRQFLEQLKFYLILSLSKDEPVDLPPPAEAGFAKAGGRIGGRAAWTKGTDPWA